MNPLLDLLTQPFDDDTVKERQGPRQHEGVCTKKYGQCTQKHKMLSYVDARDVAERLDAVLGMENWAFEVAAVPGANVVHGRLMLFLRAEDEQLRWIAREDHGYPNSDDDDEPLKSATSDALKRCAVLFGIGRHLYGDNKPKRRAVRRRRGARQRAADGGGAGRTRPPSRVRITKRQVDAAPLPERPRIAEPVWQEPENVTAAMELAETLPRAVPVCPEHHKVPMKPSTKFGGFYCSAKDGDKWCKEGRMIEAAFRCVLEEQLRRMKEREG